jgi:hypothetical protein
MWLASEMETDNLCIGRERFMMIVQALRNKKRYGWVDSLTSSSSAGSSSDS